MKKYCIKNQPKKIFSFIILHLLIIFSLGNAAWESIGPAGGNLRAMARSRFNESIIYAASFTNPAHILKSTDTGNSWSRIATIPDHVYCLEIDPLNADIIYAGCSCRVYKSTNGGTAWNSYAVSDYNIYDLAIHPSEPQTIRAAGAVKVGVYFYTAFLNSTNAGINWITNQLIVDKKSCAYCITIDPSNSQVLYIGGSVMDSLKNPYIFKSTNGGANFADISTGLAPCSTANAIAMHPTNSSIIYFSTDNAMYRSTDFGNSWNNISSFFNVRSFATTLDAPEMVVAGADTTVYRSTDAGLSWSASSTQFYGREFYNIAVCQTESNDICAGNNAGFVKTTNGGLSWFVSNNGLNENAIDNFGISRQSPSTIYIEIDEVGEFKTSDQGMTWTMLPDFLSCGMICRFAVHNASADTVYALEGVG